MSSVFDKLLKDNLIKPPHYLKNNIVYEVITGSHAYGTNEVNKSDFDIYGVGLPPIDLIFPHLKGEIPGFGKQTQKFEQFSQHHINYQKKFDYDITIYNIIKYFQLCMENNPNMVDTLFVPLNCITYINSIGQIIRENRKKFLHKGSYYKFLGYAHSMLHKLSNKNEDISKLQEISKKININDISKEDIEKEISSLSIDELRLLLRYKESNRLRQIFENGQSFDYKFAMHLVRLAYEAEQILLTGELDLQQHKEHLKAIRRGDVDEQDIRDWFSEKEKYLEKLYHDSKLQHSPNEKEIKQILLDCLESHYGSLEKCIVQLDKYENIVRQIQGLVSNV